MTRIIITGGLGFIGHSLVEHLLRNTDWHIIIIDKLSYASRGFDRLRSMGIEFGQNKRVTVFTYDLCQPLSVGLRSEFGKVDYIVHLAAHTHIEDSIANPTSFILNNVMSTVHLLEYARTLSDLKLFFYFSTDEVFGSAPPGVAYTEDDKHTPTNPYSASKSAAEQICMSYNNTYKVPVIVCNTMNAFGERQHVEKFIPKVIKSILRQELIQVHADSTCTTPGSRFFIHTRNIAAAVLFLIHNGVVGEKYNIRGECEIDNLELVQTIHRLMLEISMEENARLKACIEGREKNPGQYCVILPKGTTNAPIWELINFHELRPHHDLRYCLDGSKLHNMGFQLPMDFVGSLKKTIRWTLKNPEWLTWDL
jgi:dTDP-glucose 4,6-dehydratase